jgi:hypothetical protein
MNPQADERGRLVIDPRIDLIVRRVHTNIQQELIVTTEDKLTLCLNEALQQLAVSSSWTTPPGIVITLAVVFPTAAFQDWIIPALSWKTIFINALLLACVWFIASVRHCRNSPSVQSIIERLKIGSPGLLVETESPDPGERVIDAEPTAVRNQPATRKA